MQGKDMFLKKNRVLSFLIIIFFINNIAYANTNSKNRIINYLENLNNMSVSFLQNDGDEMSEGEISIGKKRVRVDYKNPSRILIILDEDKAMYYNYDLDEDEFFDPRDTAAWFFFDIFKNIDFLIDAEISIAENNIILTKSGKTDLDFYILTLFFEDNPLVIRKIKLKLNENFIIFSIYDHNFNKNFSEDFFKLINPNFFN